MSVLPDPTASMFDRFNASQQQQMLLNLNMNESTRKFANIKAVDDAITSGDVGLAERAKQIARTLWNVQL